MKTTGFSPLLLCVLMLLVSGFSPLGCCEDDTVIRMKLGGDRDRSSEENSAEIESLARFAVLEHNKKENAVLEFIRVLKVTEQVVAGKLYHVMLEAIDDGKMKVYEAKVWVKPWMNIKKLQEFKHIADLLSFTRSDLGVKQGGHDFGWRAVSTNDPEVQEAANHAVKSIQQRSNSLHPYELLDILLAKAKVLEEYAKFELLLKLRRGINEENFVVEVLKNHNGEFY